MTSHQQAIEALARVLHSLSPDALYSGLFHGDAETIVAAIARGDVPGLAVQSADTSCSLCPGCKRLMGREGCALCLNALVAKIRDRLGKRPWRDAGHHCEARNSIMAIQQMVEAALTAGAAPLDEVRRDFEVEDLANEIYEHLPYDGPGLKPLWVRWGNALKQDECREAARKRLTAGAAGGEHVHRNLEQRIAEGAALATEADLRAVIQRNKEALP